MTPDRRGHNQNLFALTFDVLVGIEKPETRKIDSHQLNVSCMASRPVGFRHAGVLRSRGGTGS